MGVIAGFGFTALDHVQVKLFFIFGETMLLGTIIYALLWIQKIYTSEFDALEASSNKLKGLFRERAGKFISVWNKINADREVDDSQLTELQNFGDKILQAFNTQDGGDQKNNGGAAKLYPRRLYIFLFVGSFFLLLSFIAPFYWHP